MDNNFSKDVPPIDIDISAIMEIIACAAQEALALHPAIASGMSVAIRSRDTSALFGRWNIVFEITIVPCCIHSSAEMLFRIVVYTDYQGYDNAFISDYIFRSHFDKEFSYSFDDILSKKTNLILGEYSKSCSDIRAAYYERRRISTLSNKPLR